MDRAAAAAQLSGDLVDFPAAFSEFTSALRDVVLCSILRIAWLKPIRQRGPVRWGQASVPARTLFRIFLTKRQRETLKPNWA